MTTPTTTPKTTTAGTQVTPELKSMLRRVKLGKTLDTLPDRLTLARQNALTHSEFLELVLADEVERRDRQSSALRARNAKLDPTMTLEAWDGDAAVSYDRTVWTELISLRFVADAHNVLLLGPVGVGKTHLAHALGHIACRRGHKVHAERADRLFRRLRASRLDNSHDVEIRRLIAVDVLIIDDFALQGLDPGETADFYEIVVERHLKSATILTSNRDPVEWLAALADPLLAQSAVDRLQSAAWELVVEGESYRRRQKPSLTGTNPTHQETRP